jgi:Ankyrin repeats (3 copies)
MPGQGEKKTKDELAIGRAARAGDFKTIIAMVLKSKELASCYYLDHSILHHVILKAREGDSDYRQEIVIFLVENGADINGKSSNNRAYTPLHSAARKGLVGMVRLLISLGAKTDVYDRLPDSLVPHKRPLDYANFFALETKSSPIQRRMNAIKTILSPHDIYPS